MAFDRFLIAPFNTGLQTELKPFLIMDDAFELLQNAYVFRGRVRKRFGSQFMGSPPNQFNSRLRASLVAGGAGVGITDGAGNAAGNIRTILGDASLPLAVGMMFSIGTATYTVVSAVAGVQPMVASVGSGTFNISTGAYTITGGPALTTIYVYIAQPVMGLTQYTVGAINNHPAYGFDTRYAYTFNGTFWDRSGTLIFHGTNTNYVWATNWVTVLGQPTLYVTNFNFTLGAGTPAATDDPIWRMNPANTWTAMLGSTANGIFFLPSGLAPYTGPFVQTALIIVQFQNRLILLNTVENNNSSTVGTGTSVQYINRARWSFYGDPTAVNAWYEKGQNDNAGNTWGGAGFADASTDEAIVSAAFIKNRLIVYFERSTWELAFTGNQVDPFQWNQINSELGSQSTFSTISFDKEVLSVGNTGVHSCTGANVQRIDQKIPDQVFEIQTKNNGPIRTAGIRDYFVEVVYWAFMSNNTTSNENFANQILVYNYKNGSWALFDDCFTTFGYFEQQADTIWSQLTTTWSQNNMAWNSGIIQANQRIIIAGTPEGFVLRLIPNEESRNAPSMQITNMTFAATGDITLTIINHNLTISGEGFGYPDYILLENIVGSAPVMAFLNGTIFPVDSVVDANTIVIKTYGGLTAGTYSGSGTVARVSNIQFLSKQFNPYDKEGRNLYLAKIDFAVAATESGEITMDYYPSATELSMLQGGVQTGAIAGTGVLETSPYAEIYYPLEKYQKRLWHPIYFQTTGECIQLKAYLSPSQMVNPNISLDDFELEGMILHTQRTSSRLQ